MQLTLVTGASGFIGKAMCLKLCRQNYTVRAAVRSTTSLLPSDQYDVIAIGNLCLQTDWSAALIGVDTVIHCAARAHVMHDTTNDTMSAYRTINVFGTRRLAEQAAALGVRRLVFLSSVKVNGERTEYDAPFVASHIPNPEDSYGLSKLEAEEVLWQVAEKTGLEVVIIRSPLVYGPEVKGNLRRLLRYIEMGVPLPLGAVTNQRSMLGLNNLVDLLFCCSEHPLAAGQTFLASDGIDLSTPRLIQLIANGMGRSARIIPVPIGLLKAAGSLLNKRAEVERLIGSLQVNSEPTRARLGWVPPVSIEEGIQEMAQWYVKTRTAAGR